MPKLEEIRMYWDTNNGHDEIAKMMTTNTKLEKVVFFNLTKVMLNKLIGETDLQWHHEAKANSEYTSEDTFIRKKNNF